jgi:5-methyltetrahydropteroyltriglutamate--homocysteine methyltransferase
MTFARSRGTITPEGAEVPLPTEQIGSIPRPRELIDAVRAAAAGEIPESDLAALYDSALRDTISQDEATGSPVITDGEQTKPSSFIARSCAHEQ